MKVKVAKSAGFCSGVQRAVLMALDVAKSHSGPLYTHGPLVHNTQAIQMLRSRGIQDTDRLDGCPPGMVIVRAHGIPPQELEDIHRRGFTILDATCTHIVASRKVIQTYADRGYHILLVGDEGHPEMLGLLGYAGDKGILLSSLAQAKEISGIDKACVIAQTTFNAELYEDICGVLQSRIPTCKVFHTVCDATRMRQDEVKQLALEVEALIVVGGRHSANTKRLFELALASGKPSFCVETAQDLDVKSLSSFRSVGVTAGASTPHWVIREVVEALKGSGKPRREPTRLANPLWHLFIDTNAFLATGGLALTYACCVLLNIPPRINLLTASFLCLLGAHLFNRLTEISQDEFDEPARGRFFGRYKGWLGFVAWFSSLGSLWVSWRMGVVPFLLVALCTFGGILYRHPILPVFSGKRIRLRDITGSKDVALSAAWGTITALLPAIDTGSAFKPHAWVAFSFVFSTMFVRSTLLDVKEMQGDKLVGAEMLPVVLGKTRTKILLVGISLLEAAILVGAWWQGWVPGLAVWLLVTIAYSWAYLWLYHRRLIPPSLVCGLVADANFILAGTLAMLWSLLRG